jgi:alpha-L-fucosidase
MSAKAMRAYSLILPTLLIASTGAVLAQSYQKGYDAQVKQAVEGVNTVVAKGPYQASWDSLKKYQIPEWYQDAKFGIFIHWGVYSVPAFGSEWYPRQMYMQGSPEFKHHVATYGPQSKFGYKDFIPMFKAEKFDPDAWAELFRKAGAKFVIPVAEHHDGFPMYDSGLTDYSAAKMGPKRDIVGDLAVAVRKQGLHFGASSHRAEHWFFYQGGMQFDSDVKDPANAGLYAPANVQKEKGAKHDTVPDDAWMTNWLARSSEIVDKYHPEIMWFDWWIEQPAFLPYLEKFAAFYYNRGIEWDKGVAINYKNKAFPEGTAVLDIERGTLDSSRKLFWQTDTSVSVKSWGYIDNDTFRTPDSMVDELVDIVSKNGALLLNIGPRSDGTIPEGAQHVLLEMGKWLDVNGEAIYGTRPWTIASEGPTKSVGGSFKDTAGKPFTSEDIRFTTKQGALYAIALDWPKDGKVVIKSLAKGSPYGEIKSIQLLGSDATLKWTRDAKGVTIETPATKPGDYAFAFKILPAN